MRGKGASPIIHLLFVVVLLVGSTAWADTHVVSSCAAADVSSAVAAASDGDTVLVTCSGTVTWTATVRIPATKGITLRVQGGTNQGAPSFPLTVISDQSPVVEMNVGADNSLARVSGFKFQQSGPSVTAAAVIAIRGAGLGRAPGFFGGFRLDNSYLDSLSGEAIVVVFGGDSSLPLYGVIDHNTMHDAWRASDPCYGPYGIQVWNYTSTGSPTCWGADGWMNPFSFGDKNFVFIEDNLFENVTAGRYMRHYLSSELGGRYVARHNRFQVTTDCSGSNTDLIEGHGYCMAVSNGTGTRGAEVYGNAFSGNQLGRVVMPRGGHWLIYDNTFSDMSRWGAEGFINLQEYRAGSSGDWGQCSTTSPCAAVLGEAAWHQHATASPSYYPLPQQVQNTYLWNNLYQGANQPPAVASGGDQAFYIQEGRDFFVSTAKPAALSSYSPFTYPHPLVAAGLVGVPLAPGNVTVR